jgi:hypothetical protein
MLMMRTGNIWIGCLAVLLHITRSTFPRHILSLGWSTRKNEDCGRRMHHKRRSGILSLAFFSKMRRVFRHWQESRKKKRGKSNRKKQRNINWVTDKSWLTPVCGRPSYEPLPIIASDHLLKLARAESFVVVDTPTPFLLDVSSDIYHLLHHEFCIALFWSSIWSSDSYIAAAARDPCQSNDEAISKWTERRGIAPIGELQTPDEYDTAGI